MKLTWPYHGLENEFKRGDITLISVNWIRYPIIGSLGCLWGTAHMRQGIGLTLLEAYRLNPPRELNGIVIPLFKPEPTPYSVKLGNVKDICLGEDTIIDKIRSYKGLEVYIDHIKNYKNNN